MNGCCTFGFGTVEEGHQHLFSVRAFVGVERIYHEFPPRSHSLQEQDDPPGKSVAQLVPYANEEGSSWLENYGEGALNGKLKPFVVPCGDCKRAIYRGKKRNTGNMFGGGGFLLSPYSRFISSGG